MVNLIYNQLIWSALPRPNHQPKSKMEIQLDQSTSLTPRIPAGKKTSSSPVSK